MLGNGRRLDRLVYVSTAVLFAAVALGYLAAVLGVPGLLLCAVGRQRYLPPPDQADAR
jgi:hypothetical protein